MKNENKEKRTGGEPKHYDVNKTKGAPGYGASVPGVNTPDIDLPAFNPPVPNRAWTAMRNGVDIEELSPEERRSLYLGRDNIL